jgi:outer membrane protein assembly factor BamA
VTRDTNHLEKFYIGNVTVYPDLSILQDTMEVQKNSRMIGEYRFLYNSRKFKLPFIARNIFLRKGTLYQQSNYYKTINTFTNLGAWQQVSIDLFERYDSFPYLDATIRLYPARKFGVSIDFETSRNTGDILTTGQLFGIGLNLGLHNRNAFHESIQTTTTLGFGVELGSRLVQTLQTSLSHNIYIPRFISPIKIKNEYKLTAPTTIVNFKAAYTDRKDFFQVRSVNASWGYNWSVKNHTWQYIPFNVEYTEVSKSDSFLKLEKAIPSIRYAFNNGLIIGQILAYSKRWVLGMHSHLFRTRFEESGGLFGLIKNLERNELRRFIKGDVEYKYLFTRKKTGWAFRTFGGYGYIYGYTGNEPEYSLPFFKAYFAGGPYSMRAWQIRRLGPGSSKINDPPNEKGIDRFGNMQLEGNVEYRFNVTTIYGVKVKSALFIDAGNIWGKDFDTSNIPIKESHFNLNRFYKDLAVGGGTGVRLDFDFFLIRLDYSFKLKNPLYADLNDGWFHDIKIGAGQFQLGIGYPF